MGAITLQQAAAWCGGRINSKYAGAVFCGANNDSRKIQPGELFVALKAERDGHDFIPMALEKGASAVLCTRVEGDFPAIVVEDTRIALGQIAAGYRQHLGMKVVGVTGSVGKSTTKEMIAQVLASTYRVAKTPANHNNDIGMPMAVLSIPEDTEVAVLEMGMNHFGEISYLTNIAKPDVAVIVNIGTMHIEHLGSRQGILKAKLEILEGLRPGGKAIFNGDDDLLWAAQQLISLPVTYFGTKNPRCTVRGWQVSQQDDGLRIQTEIGKLHLPLEGEHFVPDALAALAVGLAMDVQAEKIIHALAGFENLSGRQELLNINGFHIIKDCYNAGPESMAAALKVLSAKPQRRIAVLGDMLELGANAPQAHNRIGRIAAQSADFLLAYGPNSDQVVSGCSAAGMTDSQSFAFTDKQKLVDKLIQLAKPGDTLLFKGSHGMHMELALQDFLQAQGASEDRK